MKHLSLCGLFLFSGCAFSRLTAGLTKKGAAVAVAAATLEEARRQAVSSALELFVVPGSPAAGAAAELVRARAKEFTGRSRFKGGKGVVEVDFTRLQAALDKEGLLRPAGFPSAEPRVLLLVAEPEVILDLGVGPAADALRRGLSAHGVTAMDGRDALNNFSPKGRNVEALTAAAARAGADWLLIGAASVRAEKDAASGAWRARASLIGDEYDVASSTPIDQVRSDAAALDMSSAAARGKALDQVGEDCAARVAAMIARARGDRTAGAVFVTGAFDLPRLKAFLSSLRGTEGVAGANLAIWRDEDGAAIIRIFLAGLKTDGLSALLLRRDPGLTLLSVEPDEGRLAVEIGGWSKL
jgi:hypothetical protein